MTRTTRTLIRMLKFVAAMLIALSIGAQLNLIKIIHPGLEQINGLALKGIKFIFLIFFP